MNIGNIRTDYLLKTLSKSDVAVNPMEQFQTWWKEAVHSEIEEVNAMTLATATPNGVPSARIVLLKEFDENGFEFFTNYDSRKGHDMLENPNVALVFFWKELQRQVRIEGIVEKVSAKESDDYFHSRPIGSQIGAWASPQSQVIANRNVLETNDAKYAAEFGEKVPRPEHWGGYRVRPVKIEFWQGRHSRLHDRILYSKISDSWKIERLAP